MSFELDRARRKHDIAENSFALGHKTDCHNRPDIKRVFENVIFASLRTSSISSSGKKTVYGGTKITGSGQTLYLQNTLFSHSAQFKNNI